MTEQEAIEKYPYDMIKVLILKQLENPDYIKKIRNTLIQCEILQEKNASAEEIEETLKTEFMCLF